MLFDLYRTYGTCMRAIPNGTGQEVSNYMGVSEIHLLFVVMTLS